MRSAESSAWFRPFILLIVCLGIGWLAGVTLKSFFPGVSWWVLSLALGGLIGIAYNFAYWIAGWRGLDQWPNPHGRFYDQWLSLPPGAGDYYEWLALQKGHREPWASWAARHRKGSGSSETQEDRP